MTDQERNQVLKMIEDGKVSPEDGLKLLQALDQSTAEEVSQAGQVSQQVQTIQPVGQASEPSGVEVDPRIQSIKSTVQRLWQIPLWIGIGITILSAVGMFLIMRGPGPNFWFYFMILPMLLGVLIIALAVGTHKARWLFVDIQEKSKSHEHPHRIFFGFPLPLKFAAWFIKTFRRWIPDLKSEYSGVNIDEIINIFETGLTTPLIAHVDEGEDGDKVKVFIG